MNPEREFFPPVLWQLPYIEWGGVQECKYCVHFPASDAWCETRNGVAAQFPRRLDPSIPRVLIRQQAQLCIEKAIALLKVKRASCARCNAPRHIHDNIMIIVGTYHGACEPEVESYLILTNFNGVVVLGMEGWGAGN